MTLQPKNDTQPASWKSQAYVVGAAVGTLFGLIAAYLYARAADENVEQTGNRPDPIGTGQMIALGLAALGLIRQISELGKPNKKK